MTQQEYYNQEMTRFYHDRKATESESLFLRKEAQREYHLAMCQTPEIVAERIGWLLNGTYGYAPRFIARDIVCHPRMNRVAALSGLIAECEWNCPQRMAIEAWKRLTKKEQAIVDRAIQAEIQATERRIG